MRAYRQPKEEILRVEQSSTLMAFLQSALVGRSRNTVKSYLLHRQVSVNGQVCTAFDAAVGRGDTVVVSNIGAKAPNPNNKIRIVFEDDDVLVVEKKNGVLSSNKGERANEESALSIATEHVRRKHKNATVFLTRSLEREISGLLLLAKTEEAATILQQDWAKNAIEQRFLAVVEGSPAKTECRLESWLTPDTHARKWSVSASENSGKKAISFCKTLKQNERYSQVEVQQLTDVVGQIRAQLAAEGTPIAGDKRYGALSNPLGRLCLHAQTLTFFHPFSGQKMAFDTGVPASFR